MATSAVEVIQKIRDRQSESHYHDLHWEGSFEEYLRIVQENPYYVPPEDIAGSLEVKALRRRAGEHGSEEVGARLRAMMPWLAENKLVDKTKN